MRWGARICSRVNHLDTTLESVGSVEVSLSTSTSENLSLDHQLVGA